MTQTAWPELPLAAWKDTYATLHLWTQIVGKIRLAQTPWLTSPIPYGDHVFQLDFDFLSHVLRASTSDGGRTEIELVPRTVADFYAEVMRALSDLGIEQLQRVTDLLGVAEAEYRLLGDRFWMQIRRDRYIVGR